MDDKILFSGSPVPIDIPKKFAVSVEDLLDGIKKGKTQRERESERERERSKYGS